VPFTPAAAAGAEDIEAQAARRRTFAIVSHPDAGKTTTTEKLLLYAGALERAGSVKARSGQTQTTSDWMERIFTAPPAHARILAAGRFSR